MQLGDVNKSLADNSKLLKKIGQKKFVNIEKGIKLFIDWYKTYYNTK